MDINAICRGIEHVETISGRSHLIRKNDITIIDDCYNANPVSMRASLDVLSKAKGRKIAVLGDMGELGESERSLHAQTGRYAAEKQIDFLYCTGELSKEMVRATQEAKNNRTYAMHFETKEELIAHLRLVMQKGDTILIKASHFMQFPKIVEALTIV